MTWGSTDKTNLLNSFLTEAVIIWTGFYMITAMS